MCHGGTGWSSTEWMELSRNNIGGTGVVSVSSSYRQVCVITSSGSIACTDAESSEVTTEYQRSTFIGTPVDICAGHSYFCSRTNVGRVHCWGSSVPDPATKSQRPWSTPTMLTGLRGLVGSLHCGHYTTMCVSYLDGNFHCWGRVAADSVSSESEDSETGLSGN